MPPALTRAASGSYVQPLTRERLKQVAQPKLYRRDGPHHVEIPPCDRERAF
jgi:hypothetical protein